MKNISVIHPVITENTEDLLKKRAPHTTMHKSHNILISALHITL